MKKARLTPAAIHIWTRQAYICDGTGRFFFFSDVHRITRVNGCVPASSLSSNRESNSGRNQANKCLGPDVSLLHLSLRERPHQTAVSRENLGWRGKGEGGKLM